MLVQLDNLANLSQRIAHHAVLLSSSSLSLASSEDGSGGLPFPWFAAVAHHFCGIAVANTGDDEKSWAQAAQHSDVFIADRARSILRLEDVATVTQVAAYPPLIAKRRLFFIDNCERLNLNATNSLLKLLEEPLIPCLFLLTASRVRDVLPTIVSRCFRLQAKIENGGEHQEALPLDAADWRHLSEHLTRACQVAPSPLGSSLWNGSASSGGVKASQVQNVVAFSERLAKQYKADELQTAVTRFVSEHWQRLSEHQDAALTRAQLRFILSDLSEWRRAKPYHPSSSHWLARILLKGVV